MENELYEKTGYHSDHWTSDCSCSCDIGVSFVYPNGEKAVVTLDGTVILEQPLQEDCNMPIRSENGENVLRIENGKVRITEADCRDQICVNHKEISKAGESIVCLPHGLVVEIKR